MSPGSTGYSARVRLETTRPIFGRITHQRVCRGFGRRRTGGYIPAQINPETEGEEGPSLT